jgi:glutathione synthase/RimK-type ligase-like ATP-grasp enzyme
MRRCAFLTTDNLDWYTVDDHLAVPAVQAAGWAVNDVSWRAPNVDWAQFDVVIIRSPWDYQDDPAGFLHCLVQINAATRLANPLSVVRWNLRKTYLLALQQRGVAVVPTQVGQQPTSENLARHFDAFHTTELIIKPVIGASAHDTFRLKREEVVGAGAGALTGRIAAALAGRDYLAQSFLPAILTEGEYSLFYFNGEYSHTIQKVPRPGDFRVQEEHGGMVTAVDPDETLLTVAGRALAAITPSLLYARVDLVRLPDGSLAVMELELIEPALYFRMDPDSPGRFARALNDWVDFG